MIINFTQHNATTEQIEVGVVDLIPAERRSELLTFVGLPTAVEIHDRAAAVTAEVVNVAEAGTEVMIGGAPFFMGTLEAALKANGFMPVYAFSERVSVEIVQDDGSVVKTAKFVHKGFVRV